MAVSDGVIKVFNDMKVRKSSTPEEESEEAQEGVLFCLSEDKKNIILEEGKEILVGDGPDGRRPPMPPLSRCCQTKTAATPYDAIP